MLSGPTLAPEVARGLPAAVTLACADADVGKRLVEALGTPTFRPYLANDIVGAQVGGSVKNVLAIACGIVAGRKLGDNARAALITRGLAEVQRLGRALGAHPATLMGLSGLGDLVLTCNSLKSRNLSLGLELGRGVPVEEVARGLGSFRGVDRRFQVRGRVDGITIIDDYAHHPTAIRTTLEGLRQRVGKARILAVLEPRSNTMKRGVMKDALPPSLAQADRVYIYTSGLGWDARSLFALLGARARCEEELEALVGAVAGEARTGDHVLIMSNGGFGGFHDKLLARLSARV